MALSSSPGIAQQYVAGAAARGAGWAQRLARQNVPQQGIAGTYVQNHANSGAPWAQKLAGSPWGGHGPNTQAGWQQAGYGQPQSSTPGPSTTPPPAPPPGPVNPNYDSTSLAAIHQNDFAVGQKVNALNMQGGFADTALQTALGNLAYQEPRDELQAEEAAGRRGGVYSTVLDQQLGDLAHSYLTRQSAAQTSHDNAAALRAGQIKGLQGGIPLFDAGQAAATTIREANANAKNPALGESTRPLTPGQRSAKQVLAAALVAAHKTGRPQRTLTQGRTVITRPNGTQQATHTAGGMFGGTVTRTPAQTAALRALLGGK